MFSPAEQKRCCPDHFSCPSNPQFPRTPYSGNSPRISPVRYHRNTPTYKVFQN
jgi:hypothetical protein